jgi:ABC-type lipoprotein export system ATPase subunit
MSRIEIELEESRKNHGSGGDKATAGEVVGTAGAEKVSAAEKARTAYADTELDELFTWTGGAESAAARIAQSRASGAGAGTAPADSEPRRDALAARGTEVGAGRFETGRATKTIIRGTNVSKRYVMSADNYVDAVRDASIEIHEGEMVAVMGPSGSGKSTLVHILGCLDDTDSGEVWLDGRRVDNLKRRDLAKLRRNEVGFIFQTFNLVPSFTALENVMLAAEYAGKSRREARGAAQVALAQVGLADRLDHKSTELSGGQQQRVAIARALVNGPKVIFGDEPTGNLDSTSSTEIVQMMQEINAQTGTTFVLVTHDPNVAAKCDHVFHMLDGRVTIGNGHTPVPGPGGLSPVPGPGGLSPVPGPGGLSPVPGPGGLSPAAA